MTDKEPFNKQNLKKQRIRNYFLEAARSIIINEGAEYVSVRKVADSAGYSYATIYNYFADLNDLLWEVKGLLINDMGQYIGKQVSQPLNDKEGIKKLFVAYIDYYYENPNVFKFFYLYQIRRPQKDVEDNMPDFNTIWKETFKGFVLEGKIMEKDIEVLVKIFIYAMQGMLSLSLSGNWDMTKEDAHRDLLQIVDYLL